MTLTSILPSLRRSLPDPADLDRWPAHTRFGIDDVVIAGVSMTRLAALCGTPCVHTGDAVVPGTQGRASTTAAASVVVVTVLEVMATQEHRLIRVDAHVADAPVIWSQARLLGRTSTVRDAGARILLDDSAQDVDREVVLPGDLGVGDQLAVPLAGFVTHRALL